MPLFVLLSGFFSRRKNDSREFFCSLKGIALSLLIFQAISLLLLYFVRHEFTAEYLVKPYWTLWYLLSLIFWRIMLQFTPEKLLQKPVLYLIIASVVSVFSGLVLPYGQVLSIQRTLSFYPFFLLGYYMGQSLIKVPINSVTKVFAWVVIIIMSCLVFCGVMPDCSSKLLLGSFQFSLNLIPAKLFLFACSVVMSLSFYIVFYEWSVLKKIGRDSLFYYLYHGLLIQFVLIPFFQYFDIQWNFITIIVSFLIMVFALWLMSKSRLLHKLINPLKKI